MKRIASIIFATTFLVTAFYVSSCKKKKEDATPSDGVTSESNEAQNQWDDVLKIAEKNITDQGEATVRTSADPGITKETISEGSFIGKITVDYGTATIGNDGRTRSGKIIIKYTGKYRTTGTVIQSTTENYYVNGKHIKGRRTVTNNGSYVYNVVDSDSLGTADSYAQIIYPDGKITTWKSTRLRTWTSGYNSNTNSIADLTDDVYSISGSASGVSREGYAYSVDIQSLIVKLECYLTYFTYMPSGGKIVISSTGGQRTVDYGNGTSCDRNVSYTHTDGKTYELSL